MKTLPPHQSYILFPYLPVFILAFIVMVFFPQQTLLALHAHWLILLLLLITVFSPWGNRTLGKHSNTTIKLPFYLLLIFLVSFAIPCVYLGIAYISLSALPTTNLTFTAAQALQMSNHAFLMEWGFFPWGIFILLGVTLAYLGFHLKQQARISVMVAAVLKTKSDDATGLTLDFLTRPTILLSLASTIGFSILLITTGLAALLHLTLNVGLDFACVVITTVLFMLIVNKSWGNSIQVLSMKEKSLAFIALLYVIAIVFLLLVLNALMALLIPRYPMLTSTLPILFDTQWSLSKWMTFSVMWFLTWSPLMGGLIAYLSRGYKIRTVILACGVMMAIVALLMNQYLIPIISDPSLNFLKYLLPLLGAAILVWVFTQAQFLPYLARCMVPGTYTEKARPLHLYKKALLQIAVFFVIFYLPLGMIVIRWFVFLFVFPIAVAVFIFSPLAFIRILGKKNAA